MHPTANRKNPLSVSGEPAIKALWHLAHLKLRPGGVRAVTTAPVGLAVLCPPDSFRANGWRRVPHMRDAPYLALRHCAFALKMLPSGGCHYAKLFLCSGARPSWAAGGLRPGRSPGEPDRSAAILAAVPTSERNWFKVFFGVP